MPRHSESMSPLATDPKKDSRPHVHLFELIERHRRFILGRTQGLDDLSLEGSPVGPLAVDDLGAYEPLEQRLFDPPAAVDEFGGDDSNRMAVFNNVARGADAPVSSRTTSTSCPQCSAWLTAQRLALRSRPSKYPNEITLCSPKLDALPSH
jgi:hypothetical protein